MGEAESSSNAGLSGNIIGTLSRRHSTATVLFHHAIAERLGLGPGDHKCLDLLYERGSMNGSELAAVTGFTTGAITGVVARLERSGFLYREPDPADGRKQILRPAPQGVRRVSELFEQLRIDAAGLLEGFDDHQLEAIAQFLERGSEFAYERVAMLRGQTFSGGATADAAPVVEKSS